MPKSELLVGGELPPSPPRTLNTESLLATVALDAFPSLPSPWWRPLLGGFYVYRLTEELVSRGHEVSEEKIQVRSIVDGNGVPAVSENTGSRVSGRRILRASGSNWYTCV